MAWTWKLPCLCTALSDATDSRETNCQPRFVTSRGRNSQHDVENGAKASKRGKLVMRIILPTSLVVVRGPRRLVYVSDFVDHPFLTQN